jgi:hypothetical protein
MAAVCLLAMFPFYSASVPRRERGCAATDPGKSRRNLLQHRKIETHAYAYSASANGLILRSGTKPPSADRVPRPARWDSAAAQADSQTAR